MDDLRRNGSGYVDQTAYQAIRNTEGVKEMETIKRGEIWKVEYKDGYEFVVILSVKAEICNVLILKDKRTRMNDIEINAHGIRYANPSVISNKHNRSFIEFVRSLKHEEFSKIMRVVMEALNVCEFCNQEAPDSIDFQWECKQLELQLQEAQAEIKRLKEAKEFKDDRCEEVSELTAKTVVELAKVTAERDLYKQMYEKLLDKLVER